MPETANVEYVPAPHLIHETAAFMLFGLPFPNVPAGHRVGALEFIGQ